MLIEDEVVGDVPEAADDGGAGEDGAEFGHVAVQLAQVALVVALAALVVDDDDRAVGTADDAQGIA